MKDVAGKKYPTRPCVCIVVFPVHWSVIMFELLLVVSVVKVCVVVLLLHGVFVGASKC